MLRILHVMSTHGRNAVPCKCQTNKTASRIYKETAGCYQYQEEYFTTHFWVITGEMHNQLILISIAYASPDLTKFDALINAKNQTTINHHCVD